jgi:uncharacterized membrane protein
MINNLKEWLMIISGIIIGIIFTLIVLSVTIKGCIPIC